MKHIEPKYFGYKGGFDNLVQCTECQSIALYEDMHPVNPCELCGGKLKEDLVGKWIEPELKVKSFLFITYSIKVIKDGYWKLKEQV